MIAKIQFRQDTKENWESIDPILASGEPGFVVNGENAGKFKIGDGVNHWSQLAYQTSNNAGIGEPVADNKLYVRKRLENSAVGDWVEVTHESLDPRKSVNDIYSAPYETEIDLNKKYVLSDGTEKEVYAFRFTKTDINNSQTIVFPEECQPTKILDAMATLSVGTRQYLLPVENSHVEAELVLEERTPTIIVRALEQVTNAQLDSYIIYIKD